MKDRRSVDDISINELERILKIKKQRAREERLRGFRDTGRALRAQVTTDDPADWSPPRRGLRLGRLTSRALWFLEVAAVAGLVYLAYDFWQARETINEEVQEVISAENAPTAAPTPMITVLVLPSGHTPPTDLGGARPNDAEIPENLRPLVQALPAVVIPTPGPRQATRIVIPAINVDAPVVQGDGWEQLRRGVGQHIGTASPGQNGNLVVSAHNDIFGEIFRDLDRLAPGDTITIHTMGERFNYVITGSDVVEPTAVEVMTSTSAPTATLISCYPYLVDTKRIVVFAELEDSI
ncbi:MAG TPA: class D sortase [Anaerolineales bacterium]|jgi:sortase A|nr:class D sortase [Anaerolineales bacterium]